MTHLTEVRPVPSSTLQISLCHMHQQDTLQHPPV